MMGDLNRKPAFDVATDRFTQAMRHCANWKETFFGAAYASRLRAAIKLAREECDRMEKFLDD